MEPREYIESGILELYVYGLLSDAENLEVSKMAAAHAEIDNEIISIEKAIVNLSTSFSPYLSADNFEKIKAKLALKHSKVVQMKPRSNVGSYLGWAAALLMLLGLGYVYMQYDQTKAQMIVVENQQQQIRDSIFALEQLNEQSESALAVIRDSQTTVVPLAGQAVAPDSFAKVYWNQTTQTVYVDAIGLPEAPQGMVYQVWALKLDPLTPTSIGLLDDPEAAARKFFALESIGDADAFGITLEPAGGSVSPTLEQLYTMGKV